MAKNARLFTEEEIQIIKDNNGKIMMKELADLLGWNYTVISGEMVKQRIQFT